MFREIPLNPPAFLTQKLLIPPTEWRHVFQLRCVNSACFSNPLRTLIWDKRFCAVALISDLSCYDKLGKSAPVTSWHLVVSAMPGSYGGWVYNEVCSCSAADFCKACPFSSCCHANSG
ncbi:hypothetical protein BaRGS_00028040 [Batillaria attramentaria]|uniref:Uncharacterized protein n=1 Tax=Batillaria attramentaria TaxID=370345 RepID=A0ABD0K0S5_9CAEN